MSWLWLVAALVLAFLVYGYRLPAQWRMRHIPGPAPSFLLGNMLDIQRKGSHVLHTQLAKKYGPCFKTWGVSGPVVIVTSPELVRATLLHNHNRPRFPNMNVSAEARKFDAANVLAARGDHWRSLRAAWSPIFFTGSLEGYSGLMNRAAHTMVERLAGPAKSGEQVEMWRLLGDLTLEVVAGSAYGVDLNTQKPPEDITSAEAQEAQQLREDVATFFKGFGGIRSKWFLLIVVFPELGWLMRKMATWFPDAAMTPLQEARTRLIGLTKRLIARHRAALGAEEAGRVSVLQDGAELSTTAAQDAEKVLTHKPSNGKVTSVTARSGSLADLKKGVKPGSFIDVLCRSVDKQGKPFDDVTIASQAFIMVLAGYETTANTLAFCIWCLAKWPVAQDKLAAEVRASSGDPTYQDLDRLFPYADACLREALRLFPPGAAGVREASKDQTIGGYRISRGQLVIASFYPLHRSEKYWKDPETFIPERWMPGHPEAASEETRKMAWAAFGDGSRQCPGYRFALEEARLTLVHLFRAYSFRLAPGQDPLPLRNTITLSPKNGVTVTVHPRT